MPNNEEWGKGYDFGQLGMMKAIKTAEDLATAREQKRIIKLLEEHMPNSSDHDFVGCECEYPTNNWYNNHLIALIKGENK